MWSLLVAVASMAVLASGAQAPAPSLAAAGDSLLFTQTQAIATFQSFHQAPPAALTKLLNTAPYQASFAAQQLDIPATYEFSMPSLTEQLEMGIRGLELETLADPQGGAYAYSPGLKLAGLNNTLVSPDLLQPGIKAMRQPAFDFGSSCYLFTDCLQEIANFSTANPNHFPIVLVIHHGSTTNASSFLGSQYKSALAQLQANPSVQPTNFSTATNAKVTDIVAALNQVFPPGMLYTPDNLRADNQAPSSASLRSIVFPGGALNGSWPTVGALRGKVLVMADPDYTSELLADFPGAVHSTMWPAQDDGDSDPNIVFLDGQVDLDLSNYTTGNLTSADSLDTNADAQVLAAAYSVQIMALQGFYIRASVDSSYIEAANNYTSRLNEMMTIGGAQMLSTYHVEPALYPSSYVVTPQSLFGGAVAVCNPVLTGDAITLGSVLAVDDGPVAMVGGLNITSPNQPACPLPNGFTDSSSASA